MKRFLFSLLIPASLFVEAQTPITVDDCIRMARANSYKMSAVKAQEEVSRYDESGAKALFFPSFSLSGGAIYSDIGKHVTLGLDRLPPFQKYGVPDLLNQIFPGVDLSYDFGLLYHAGVKVEQPIYVGGKIVAANRLAKIGREAARQRVRQTDADVVVATSQAYGIALKTRELVVVTQAYNTLLQELMRSVEKAAKHGMKSQNDLLKVKVKLSESELNLRRAENGYRLAIMNLCHYIGRPLSEPLSLSGELQELSNGVVEEGSIERRPEYILLQQKSAAAKQQVAMARSEHLPRIGLIGQYGYTNGMEINGRKILDRWSYLVGVQVSVPIFDFGQRVNKIRASRAKYIQAQEEEKEGRMMMALDVVRAHNKLDEAMLERDLAKVSVASATENLRASRLQYEKGLERLSDYLEANTLWQKARQTEIEAQANCYTCWLEYRKATGQID